MQSYMQSQFISSDTQLTWNLQEKQKLEMVAGYQLMANSAVRVLKGMKLLDDIFTKEKLPKAYRRWTQNCIVQLWMNFWPLYLKEFTRHSVWNLSWKFWWKYHVFLFKTLIVTWFYEFSSSLNKKRINANTHYKY